MIRVPAAIPGTIGCLFMLVMAGGVAIAGDDKPVDLNDQPMHGRLARIVKPDYPEEALARGQTGVVVLEGKLDPEGFAEDLKYLPDKPESAIFVDALKKVAADWIFVVSTDGDCQPIAAPMRTEVSFEIDDGKPRIFVTHAPAPKTTTVRKNAPTAHYRPTRRIPPEYPRVMLNAGIRANTYSKVTVDRDGNVTDVKAMSYAPRRRALELVPFDRAVQRALSEWKFPPVPAEEKAPWMGCYQVNFRLR